MLIKYQSGKPEEILEEIKEQLGGRKLGKMLHFDLENGNLGVTIKKMGTSQLYFERVQNGGALIWELQTEKIALAHKAFKSEVLEKLTKIITQTGGTVETDS